MKTYLKNKCSYARKRGYLTEKTNQKQEHYDDDEEEEEQDQMGRDLVRLLGYVRLQTLQMSSWLIRFWSCWRYDQTS